MTGVTTAFATAASGGTETAARIWVAGLAGDGTGLCADRAVMTGAEIGVRADVGAWTGQGSEGETGIWVKMGGGAAEATWIRDLTVTADEEEICTGTEVGIKLGAALKD